jgi:Ran GTPase-activating protein (RanGAP) involved in mRNA processing and transport
MGKGGHQPCTACSNKKKLMNPVTMNQKGFLKYPIIELIKITDAAFASKTLSVSHSLLSSSNLFVSTFLSESLIRHSEPRLSR